MAVLYKLTCEASGKAYIGITSGRAGERWLHHKKPSALARSSGALQNAISKYGHSSFSMELLEATETREQAAIRERMLIAEHLTMAPNGYNMTEGGEHLSKFSVSEATRKKLSVAGLGRKQTPEWIEKRIARHRGAKRSPDTCARISAAKKANFNEDTRRRMSEAQKGKRASLETREKMRAAHKNRPKKIRG